MPDYLLDTGILIRHLRGQAGYAALLDRLAQEGDLYIAAFTRVEVIRGMRDREREVTYLLLDSLRTQPLDRETANLAGEWIRAWRGRGVTLSGPDAVIAAADHQCQATLVTTNPRHFPMPEITVLAADEAGHLQPRGV